jgi:hypothetical protein
MERFVIQKVVNPNRIVISHNLFGPNGIIVADMLSGDEALALFEEKFIDECENLFISDIDNLLGIKPIYTVYLDKTEVLGEGYLIYKCIFKFKFERDEDLKIYKKLIKLN